MSALCLPSPGSAVSKHESRLGTCSDGYQVQVTYLCRPQVSFQDCLTHTHRMGIITILFIHGILTCCYPTSEQVLHLWLEVLCSSMAAVEKWYHPWSFLRSPGWVQIKCELRWETLHWLLVIFKLYKLFTSSVLNSWSCLLTLPPQGPIKVCLQPVPRLWATWQKGGEEITASSPNWAIISKSRQFIHRLGKSVITLCCFRNQQFWKQKLWMCWFSITCLVGTSR